LSKTKSKTGKKTSVEKKDVPIPYPDTEKVPPYLLRNLVDIFYDFQGQRIQTQLRIGAAKREHSLDEDQLSIYGITTIFENAQTFEKDIEKLIKEQLKNHAIYNQYLIKITGLGPMLAAALIAYTDDIKEFYSPSSLWQYCGYGGNTFCPYCKKPTFINKKYKSGKVAKMLQPFETCPMCDNKTEFIIQKRTAGYASNWNPKYRSLVWKVGKSFVMQQSKRSGYRRIYDHFKKAEKRKHPKIVKKDNRQFYTPGHLHDRAMRKTVKVFLVHFWQTWRRQEGLPASEPYTQKLLNHSTIEAFTDD